jgi:hypothetical protein
VHKFIFNEVKKLADPTAPASRYQGDEARRIAANVAKLLGSTTEASTV